MNTSVLVVEDDLEINELLGEYLALENIKYLSAITGQAGIYQATTHHPDALILDLMLPDIDGFEVARTLSTHRGSFDIPIIILSCMCQHDDKEKGFRSGALFYMNKPFLPDDLVATVRRAFEWKTSLRTRVPAGAITLGNSLPEQTMALAQAVHEMTSDLFARTDLPDAAVAQMKEALETLAQWNAQWNKEHSQNSHLHVAYRITSGSTNGGGGAAGAGGAAIEWSMTEDFPGILTDAFFQPLTGGGAGGGAGGAATAVAGWGVGSLVTKPLAPIAPPAKWIQVLAKTGATRFEKDSKSHTVRFTRSTAGSKGTNGTGAATLLSPAIVPVVEIDGTRIPNRLRDEALAARRK